MKRALIFLYILTLVIGCAGTGGDLPEWVDTHQHPKYPPQMYIIGVGMFQATGNEDTDMENAKTSALSDIARQIKVKVESQVSLEEKSVSERRVEGGREEIFGKGEYISELRVRTKTAVDMVLEGVQFVETGKAEGVYYALAVLDKMRAISALEEKRASAYNEANKYVKHAQEACQVGDIATALNMLFKARDVLITVRSLEGGIYSLGGTPEELGKLSLADVEGMIGEIVRGVNVERTMGGGETVNPGDILKLGLKAELSWKGGKYPVKSAKVVFSIGGRALKTVMTDQSGSAVVEIPAMRGKREIKAVVTIVVPGYKKRIKLGEVVFRYSLKGSASLPVAVRIANPRVREAVSDVMRQLGYKVVDKGASIEVRGTVDIGKVRDVDGFAGRQFVYSAVLRLVVMKGNKQIGEAEVKATATVSPKEDAKRKIMANLIKKISNELEPLLAEELE